MVDKINGNGGFGPLGNISRTGKAGSAKGSATSKSDSVDFSSALQNATKGQEAGRAQETARAEKIQALKAQIDNGTYQPDLEKVASSLLPFLVNEG